MHLNKSSLRRRRAVALKYWPVRHYTGRIIRRMRCARPSGSTGTDTIIRFVRRTARKRFHLLLRVDKITCISNVRCRFSSILQYTILDNFPKTMTRSVLVENVLGPLIIVLVKGYTELLHGDSNNVSWVDVEFKLHR